MAALRRGRVLVVFGSIDVGLMLPVVSAVDPLEGLSDPVIESFVSVVMATCSIALLATDLTSSGYKRCMGLLKNDDGCDPEPTLTTAPLTSLSLPFRVFSIIPSFHSPRGDSSCMMTTSPTSILSGCPPSYHR